MHDSSSHSAGALPISRILAFAAAYVLAWTLLPAWLSQSFALDVAESLSWGQEWQWGYYKHPPLAPIVLNGFYMLFGEYGPYLLSQLCIALTLWMVWRTGLRLMDRQRALIGTVLTMGVAYYNFPAIEFNHNIAQMPLWAALGYVCLAALQDGKLRQWVLLGVLAGLSLLTKYSMGVILLTLGLYLLCSAQHRRCLLRPGPWVAVALMLAIFAPHALWLQDTQGLPFTYASERAMAQGGNARLEALGFPVTQLLAHLPLLLVLAWAVWRTRGQRQSASSAVRPYLHTASPTFLLVLTLLPGAIVTLLGVGLGLRLRDMWGSPMWAFSGLLVAACISDVRLTAMRPKLLRGMAVWLVLVTLFMMVYMSFGAQLRKRAARVDWPAHAIAQQAAQTWQTYAGHCALDTVAGNYWLAGLVSAYAPSRPSVLIDGNPAYSPWVDAQRLQQHGALWIWQPSAAAEQAAPPAPLAQVGSTPALQQHEGQWQIAWPFAPSQAPLTLHWRVYVPQACVHESSGQ